ncbi:MAG: hypothetical protein WAT39_13245 [Planctomycetota bacterium]
MHPLHALGAAAALAVCGWFLSSSSAPVPSSPAKPPAPPIANGHYVLVVEGDREALAITRAVRKAEPWAGVPKGLQSAWTLAIRDARGELLADVPLDVSVFATEADARGSTRVEGCLVKTGRLGLLVNVPAFANAASYTFTRPGDGIGRIVLGTVDGAAVREFAGEGR